MSEDCFIVYEIAVHEKLNQISRFMCLQPQLIFARRQSSFISDIKCAIRNCNWKNLELTDGVGRELQNKQSMR